MDRLEATRLAVSKAAEERALKYQNIIELAHGLEDGMVKATENKDFFDYDMLRQKFDRLRDFTELKNSKHKIKVEVNLDQVLREIKEYNSLQDKDLSFEENQSIKSDLKAHAPYSFIR